MTGYLAGYAGNAAIPKNMFVRYLEDMMNRFGPLVIFGKAIVLTGVIFWVRFSMPRMREDQLQRMAWKFLIPASLLNIAATAVLKVAF